MLLDELPTTSAVTSRRKRRPTLKPIEPLAVSAAVAAGLFSLSPRGWAALDSAGKVPLPIRLGGRVCWCTRELRAWADAGCPCRQTWEMLKERKTQ